MRTDIVDFCNTAIGSLQTNKGTVAFWNDRAYPGLQQRFGQIATKNVATGVALAEIAQRSQSQLLQRVLTACGVRLSRSGLDALSKAKPGNLQIGVADIEELTVSLLIDFLSAFAGRFMISHCCCQATVRYMATVDVERGKFLQLEANEGLKSTDATTRSNALRSLQLAATSFRSALQSDTSMLVAKDVAICTAQVAEMNGLYAQVDTLLLTAVNDAFQFSPRSGVNDESVYLAPLLCLMQLWLIRGTAPDTQPGKLETSFGTIFS